MWTPGQLIIFAVVMAIVGGMAFFVWKVRSTVSTPTQCPSCNAMVARNAKICVSCGNSL